MLNAIYDFLFTPIMSKVFMGLFYGVKPIFLIFSVLGLVLLFVVTNLFIRRMKIDKSRLNNTCSNIVLSSNNGLNDEPDYVLDPMYAGFSYNVNTKD